MSKALSRERVVRAALEVVDSDGLEALSMRRVAQELGVEAMSLYRHVQNKADLLTGLHDLLLERIPLDTHGPWPDRVRQLAWSFRDQLFAHPHLVPLMATRPASTQSALAVVEEGVSLLLAEGWTEEDAVIAFQTVFAFAIGHAVFHTAGGPPQDEAWARREFEGGLELILGGLQGRG